MRPKSELMIIHMTSKQLLLGATLSTSAVVIFEHVGRLYKFNHLPSTYLSIIAKVFQEKFQLLGTLVARLSSYLTWIDLKEFMQTIHDIGTPIVNIILAPTYFIYGYVKTAAAYVGKSWMIYIGSFLIILALCLLLHYISLRYFDMGLLMKIRSVCAKILQLTK
jgi:hypothetical protein